MRASIESAVRRFVVETLLYRDGPGSLGQDDSLLDLGLIDSTAVLDLVHFLEEEFQLRVSDEEIVPENLDSLSRISAFVRRKLNGSLTASKAIHED